MRRRPCCTRSARLTAGSHPTWRARLTSSAPSGERPVPRRTERTGRTVRRSAESACSTRLTRRSPRRRAVRALGTRVARPPDASGACVAKASSTCRAVHPGEGACLTQLTRLVGPPRRELALATCLASVTYAKGTWLTGQVTRLCSTHACSVKACCTGITWLCSTHACSVRACCTGITWLCSTHACSVRA